MKTAFKNKFIGWLIHAFTASSAVIGLFALNAIYHKNFILAFWFMALTIVIDAVDGTLARFFEVKKAVPRINGELLDNIVDYFTYVIVPALFVLVSNIIAVEWRSWIAALIVLSSAYQFSQANAKTKDNFFTGFPCYWGIVLFYLYIFNAAQLPSLLTLLCFIVLIFVPMKFVYPSRMENVTGDRKLRILLLALTIGYGVASFGLLHRYPVSHPIFLSYSVAYIILYFVLSIYRTLVPIKKK